MAISARSKVVGFFALFLALDPLCASQTNPVKHESASSQQATDRFVLTTTVTNEKGEFIPGLERDHFQVFLDKQPANIIDFSDKGAPASIGFVFDASASVVDPGAERAIGRLISSLQEALKNFLAIGDGSNEYFLLAFNSKPKLLIDWTSESTSLVDSLSDVRPKGNTALYDACYLAIEKVRHGRFPKRVLILISDGLDNNSGYTFTQVREALRESDLLLYSVYLSDNKNARSALEMDGLQILNEFSSITGGMFFSKKEGVRLKVADTASIFEIIATELKRQYTIGIASQSFPGDRKWRKLKLKVTQPSTMRLSARTREGIYLNHR